MAVRELTCPDCGGHRIAQTMQASVDYLVEYDDERDSIDIVTPAYVVHGAIQYEVHGTWGDPMKVWCINSQCGYEGDIEEFLAKEERVDDD